MWKIKHVVYFHYDCKRGKSARRGNSPLHLKWPTLELNWQFLMGSFVRGLKFRGPFWHPLNSNVAPVFSKLALLMVQFGPYNWVNLAQKWCQKQPHFNGAELTPRPQASAKLDSLVLAPRNSTFGPNQLFSFYSALWGYFWIQAV